MIESATMGIVNKQFSICLNMIVKDESLIIIKTLTNLCSKINFDYWVICDTGSSDNTKELIQEFFDNRQIKGELIVNKWYDFGSNRTLALENAYNKTDYLLIFDADDEIVGDFNFPENIFEYDSYYLKFGSDTKYTRTQIINNRKKYRYVGILHEYIECLEKNTTNTSTILQGEYYINSGKFGNRSNDPNKYSKDALLLEKAYEVALKNEDDIYSRYSFYCANSYRDAGDGDNAIKWYKNTLTLNNWAQEKYISCLRLSELYNNQNRTEQKIYYLIESQKYDDTRVECMYRLIQYYCIHNQNEIAYAFYTLIQKYYENAYMNDTFEKKLFVIHSDYSFYLPYYMIIVCERLKKYELGLKMFDIIFTKQNVELDNFWIKNLVYNLQFYVEKNKEFSFVAKWREYVTLINNKKHDIDTKLINKYEIYNVNTFHEIHNVPIKLTEPRLYDNDSYIVVAILAKDKEIVLPFYLQCIYNQSYDKKFIHLYIRTNDNNDDTNTLVTEFIEKYGNEYASVYFDNSSISEKIKQYSQHEWNAFRFKIIGKIRQDSIDYAVKLNAHYFVADCDNFIIPTTLESLFQNKDIGVLSPLLHTGYNEKDNFGNAYNNKDYSNFHYSVTENGYYNYHENYFCILNNVKIGLSRVGCVHCTYFIPYKYLHSVKYIDETDRHEYVVFSESLRKNNIPQYIDNTSKYGFLTFVEKKEHFDIEYNHNKVKYCF